jgi:hypothetical protein
MKSPSNKNNNSNVLSNAIGAMQSWANKKEPTESKHILQEWTRSRCGPTGNAVWVYQGALYDPLDGKQIAEVHGLELVRCLAESTDDSATSKQRHKRRCGDLAAATAVSHPNATFDYASTVLSRRLFCYKKCSDNADTTGISNNKSSRQQPQLLTDIKLRPGSPVRKIPTDQAVAVYDTASTFVGRSAASRIREWFVHTEFPDGRSLWSKAKSPGFDSDNMNTDSLEFTVYARPRSKKKLKDQTPDLTAPVETSSSVITASPGRSALVQFGQSEAESQGRFGVRETYHYTMQNDKNSNGSGIVQWFQNRLDKDSPDTTACSVRYTRYGEGPPWYGPCRMCTLELTGKRVADGSHASPLVARIAAERVAGFLSVHAPISERDDMAARAVDWFRGKGSAVLQVTPDPADETIPAWMRRAQQTADTVVRRVREATAISIGGNNE